MRAMSRRPPARENSPAFWWGFLRGFLIASRRRSECFRASVSARFLVMAKNSGGYFSITNFLTVSHGLRGCLFFRFASLLIVCRSRAVLAVSVAFCRVGWGLLVRACFVACGAVLAVLRGRTVAAFVLRSIVARSFARCGSFAWSVVCFPPALLSFVYGCFSAFCGGLLIA